MIDFPPVEAGEDIEVSATSFVAYGQCPEQANARYRGEYGPPSRRSFIGSLSHRVFARHLRDGEVKDLAAACREEIGNSHLNLQMNELGVGRPSVLAGIISEVGELYARFRTMPADGFAGAEVELRSAPAEGVILKGKVDAVFVEGAGHRLTDWKTGEVGDAEIQLGFYALLWALDRSRLPLAVEAVSVGTGERYRAVPELSDVEATAGAVAAMVSELRRMWATGADTPRQAGPWCRFCPMLDRCDEGRAAHTVLAAGSG